MACFCRYEDLSLDPFRVVKNVYDFVGLELTSEINDWLERNTHLSESTTRRQNPFSTKRNSTSAMQAWRKHLSFVQVQNIQNMCKETMEHFGYQTISSEMELNDTNVLLLKTST